MLRSVLRRFRFSLRSVLVFILGIGVGHSLNSESLQRLIGRGVQPPPIPTHPWDQPDLLKIAVFDKNGRAITGFGKELFWVHPDGQLRIGQFGKLFVGGQSLAERRDSIHKAVATSIDSPRVFVDPVESDGKSYYVVVEMYENDVVSVIQLVGNETVLDAISNVGDIPLRDITGVSIVRPPEGSASPPITLSVDWPALARGESSSTNYQLLPGDRVHVSLRPSSTAN